MPLRIHPLPDQSLASALEAAWTSVPLDPDARVRARETMVTTEVPYCVTVRRPHHWVDAPAAIAALAKDDSDLAELPRTTPDRCVSLGWLGRLLAHEPDTGADPTLAGLTLAPNAVWTMIEFEHPAGRRWDVSRRLGRRRLEAGGWSCSDDLLRLTRRFGWDARAAHRQSITARGATYDLLVADLWRPDPIDRSLPLGQP